MRRIFWVRKYDEKNYEVLSSKHVTIIYKYIHLCIYLCTCMHGIGIILQMNASNIFLFFFVIL